MDLPSLRRHKEWCQSRLSPHFPVPAFSRIFRIFRFKLKAIDAS
jgi:hypothetical protein